MLASLSQYFILLDTGINTINVNVGVMITSFSVFTLHANSAGTVHCLVFIALPCSLFSLTST